MKGQGLLLAVGILALPRAMAAQVEDASWHSALELGMTAGGTWLEGPRAPTVSSTTGFFAGLGIQRAMSPFAASGIGMRAMTSGIELAEAGAVWNAGRVAEVSVMAFTSITSRQRSAWRTSLDLAGGLSIVSGGREVAPFRDAANIAPLGEAGLSLRYGLADADASRADWAVFARYSVVRLRMTQTLVSSSGTVSRIIAGVRMSR